MSHTPGPWHWEADQEPIDPRTFKSPGYYGNPSLVAGDDYPDDFVIGCDEYQIYLKPEDALLIAAAPDLLSALKECVEFIGDPAIRAFHVARAAVAKAEGNGAA
jgi:hypothetical protein